MTEEKLAEEIIAWLEGQHWDVYQEVQTFGSSGIADIVAVKGGIIWIIECKLSLSMTVMAQADDWKDTAHYISVAVPQSGKGKDRSFAKRVLTMLGIGMLTVDKYKNVQHSPPRLNRRLVFSKQLLAILSDKHKTFAKAGNSSGMRWTPYANTCDIIARLLKDRPLGVPCKEVMDHLRGKHHYASDQSCRSSLLKWGAKGGIRGVRLERKGKEILFFNEPTTL